MSHFHQQHQLNLRHLYTNWQLWKIKKAERRYSGSSVAELYSTKLLFELDHVLCLLKNCLLFTLLVNDQNNYFGSGPILKWLILSGRYRNITKVHSNTNKKLSVLVTLGLVSILMCSVLGCRWPSLICRKNARKWYCISTPIYHLLRRKGMIIIV